jgi:serine/threonine protein kinase
VADPIPAPQGATTRLGSFEIVRKLARGGMAEIFLARTRGPSDFEKLVVLKKILPRYAGNRRLVQLFLDEARLVASLDHPSIAQVYDIGMVDGSYFFTMEHLHGQDLRAILSRASRTGQAFPIEHAVQIARHVAAALHFAHDKQHRDGTRLGIVHRDVSPSNIIVTYDGTTKLLDFGVAKTTASSVHTRTGALKGKVAYMSPEQAKGATVDRRSDIFSLGIVLWEMITLQRLYRADNDLATLQLILHAPPRPPSALRPDCPAELERIVRRALAGDPAERYPAADQLVNDLDELAREHKLKQSSSALAAMVSELFADELAAWRVAEAAGVALADHLHGVGDLTTPVSDAELLGLDDDLDDALDDAEPARDAAAEPDELDRDDELTEHVAPLQPRVGEPQRASEPDLDAPTEINVTRDQERFALASPALEPVVHPTPSVAHVAVSHPAPNPPFSVPPWQTGQPASPSPAPRSWAVVELPEIDPAQFARQRSIVVRVAAAILGLIVAVAIAAGRC